MPIVLVTGAAGRVASYLIPELLAHGYRVRGFDLKPATFPDVEMVIGDVRSFDEVLRATEGVEKVCHLAAIPWDGLPTPDLIQLNVVGTVHVFEAAERCGANRVVHTSSVRAYGLTSVRKPTRPLFLPVTEDHPTLAAEGYGMSKAAADVIAQCYNERGLSVIVLRPGGVVDFTQEGRGRWGPFDAGVHAPDAAVAFRLALETERRHGIYNVVSTNRYCRDGTLQPARVRREELASVDIGRSLCGREFWSGKGNVYANDRIRRELGWEPTW